MQSKINKVGLALILSLTTALSSNLGAVELQIEPQTQVGYYYLPPQQLKKWEDLTPQQQKKAAELGYNRDAFAKWLIQTSPTPISWGESMGFKPQKETNTTNTKK